MNDISRQERAKQLVQREVKHCITTQVSGLVEISSRLSDEEFTRAFGDSSWDLMELCETTDYETPGRQFVENDADMADLEWIAHEFGDVDALIDEIVPKLHETVVDGRTMWGVRDEPAIFDDKDDARFEAFDSVKRKMAAAIADLVTDWESICTEFDVEPAHGKVYEHWIVSEWFAEKLKEKGEAAGEFAGMCIWGRGTTGQSMCLDDVIQRIAADIWPDEVECEEDKFYLANA